VDIGWMMFLEASLLSIKVLWERNHSMEQTENFSSGWMCKIGPYLEIAVSRAARDSGAVIFAARYCYIRLVDTSYRSCN